MKLTEKDFDLVWDACDFAIEPLVEHWSKDQCNTESDLFYIMRNIRRFRKPERKLNGPNRPEVPVPSRNAVHGVSGARLKPLTRFGLDAFPPVTVSTSRVGRSAAAADGRDAQ